MNKGPWGLVNSGSHPTQAFQSLFSTEQKNGCAFSLSPIIKSDHHHFSKNICLGRKGASWLCGTAFPLSCPDRNSTGPMCACRLPFVVCAIHHCLLGQLSGRLEREKKNDTSFIKHSGVFPPFFSFKSPKCNVQGSVNQRANAFHFKGPLI